MTHELVLIEEKGNMRRFRRGMQSFDPNAVDADNDGLVQEGTPFQRPSAPRARQRRGNQPRPQDRLNSFWDYRQPKPLPVLDELEDEVKPQPRNWREIQLKPKPGEIPVDTVVHKITTDKVKRDEWFAFHDAILERMMELRDDATADKDTRRGIAKLYASVRDAKPEVDKNGNLVIGLTDTKRARILKGIQSMRKKKYDIPHMDIIFEMLDAVDKKSAIVPTNFHTGRPFVGVRYKNLSLMHITVADVVEEHPTLGSTYRSDGFRIKGEMPRQRIDIKALGRSIAGSGRGARRSGRLVTSRFDPNAVDADNDGLVQEGTAFERPATPSKPSIIGPQKPITGGLPEGIKKPQRQNSVMKAQADRKAMNFQIEKLRSTLRRVGDDYVPSWWNTKDSKEFQSKIQNASPEELSEIFARIYVERRSLMVSRVGRMPDGKVKVFADAPDKKTEALDRALKARGEAIYKEMFGRIMMRDDMDSIDAKERNRRSKQFMDWYQLTADNADWYFEQSFKITKRKSRKKRAIDAPVNRRGTRWAEDPNFPENAFESVVESIETDLRRANPSISDQSARRRAEEIVRDADKRISRSKPDKSPRSGGNRQVVNPEYSSRRLRRRIEPRELRELFEGKTLKWRGDYVDSAAQYTPQIPTRDSAKAVAAMNNIIASNEQVHGQLQTPADFRKAFSKVAPNAKIDLLKKQNLNDYEQKILHGYLDVFTNNPQVTRFPITIQAQDSADTLRGIGGGHGIVFNKDKSGRDTFAHYFFYSAYDDMKQTQENTLKRSLMNGGVLGLNDGVSNQVLKDFYKKNYRPNMTPAELDDLYEKGLSLEAFGTSLHEGGHGAHLSAIMLDMYGNNMNGKAIMAQVEAQYKAMSEPDKRRAIRNTLHSVLGPAVALANDEALKPLRDLIDANFDVSPIILAYQNDLPVTDPSIIGSMNPVQKQIWAGVLREELATPGAFKTRMRISEYAMMWNQMGIRDQSDLAQMEKFINDFTNDPDIKSFGLKTYIDKFPMTPNGEIDVKKLMNPNTKLFSIPSGTGSTVRNYNFYESYIENSVKFMAHKQFQYDSLSEADKKLAEQALSKISYYARVTQRYGPGFGKTHVEGLAELHAAKLFDILEDGAFLRQGKDLWSPFTEGKFTADELRVMNALFAWLRR